MVAFYNVQGGWSSAGEWDMSKLAVENSTQLDLQNLRRLLKQGLGNDDPNKSFAVGECNRSHRYDAGRFTLTFLAYEQRELTQYALTLAHVHL